MLRLWCGFSFISSNKSIEYFRLSDNVLSTISNIPEFFIFSPVVETSPFSLKFMYTNVLYYLLSVNNFLSLSSYMSSAYLFVHWGIFEKLENFTEYIFRYKREVNTQHGIFCFYANQQIIYLSGKNNEFSRNIPENKGKL